MVAKMNMQKQDTIREIRDFSHLLKPKEKKQILGKYSK